jgi:hypothetical protein
MKTFKTLLLMAAFILLAPLVSNAQDMYRIHEDVVKPSHVAEYEGILAEMMAMVNKAEVKDARWITLVSNNSHYSYISPIKNMADLDKPNFIAQLIEKEGRDKVMGLFTRMDKCYDTELDYIISLNRDLSYMPNGITQTPEGENYRQNHKLYVSPANSAIVTEKLKTLKKLYETNGSKSYYRVYNSGFGTDGEFIMVATAAIDDLDMAQKGKQNRELIGEKDLQDAIFEMYANTLRYEKIEGEIRPDLGYTAKL